MMWSPYPMNLEIAETELYKLTENEGKIKEYNNYWSSLTPTDDEAIKRRYVFSFLSVHTPWSANVTSFLLLDKNKQALSNKEELTQLLVKSRAGNHHRKSEGIYRFVKDFDENPGFYKLNNDSPHQEQRDRIMDRCYGLGLAKTAFALEMCFPMSAQVVCLDTHILQLYGHKESKDRAKVNTAKYKLMENHWLKVCKDLNMAPAVARAIWWDKKQQQENSRYWTYTIE